MKNQDLKRLLIKLGVIALVFGAIYLAFVIHVYNYIEASMPKITEDIDASESAILQDEFGINLPPEAKITAFSFTFEEIKIQIEGVEDLPAFLTDSLPLGLDREEAEKRVDRFNQYPMNEVDTYEDLYGNVHHPWGFYFADDFPESSLDRSIRIVLFYLDDKLVIEMRKSDLYVSSFENTPALMDMVGKPHA